MVRTMSNYASAVRFCFSNAASRYTYDGLQNRLHVLIKKVVPSMILKCVP